MIRCRVGRSWCLRGARAARWPTTRRATPSPARRRRSRRLRTLDRLAAEPPTADTLLELLGSANARDRKPIWRRYDHMNGTNTLVGPGSRRRRAAARQGHRPRAGAGDRRARSGAGRRARPLPRRRSAVVEGALNVACSGATPIGVTDCLNFGSPETELGAWQLERAIDGIAAACRALALPVVSGNVSLYNETPDGPILPTPVVGTVGVLEDREARAAHGAGRVATRSGSSAIQRPMSPPSPASELAWRRGRSRRRPDARRRGRRRRDPAAARARARGPGACGARLLRRRHRCRAGAHGDRGGVGARVDLTSDAAACDRGRLR